jgi:hypothetical protein
MKRIMFAAVIFAAMMCGCASDTEKPAVVQYVNDLVMKFPNYRSNEIARTALLDSIANHVRPVGQSPVDIAGVDFKFAKLVDNPQTGAKTAVFTSTGCTSDIENPNGNPKYLMTDINIRVVGTVDDATAAKLDNNNVYRIDGKLHAWDAADVFGVTHSIGNAVDFGTYILDDMTINPAKSK